MRFYLCICSVMMGILLSSAMPAMALDPIRLDENSISGGYIGKHISILNEQVLFKTLAGKWDVDSHFKQKMLSGELHSDGSIQMRIDNLPLGYRAILNRVETPDREKVVEWGVRDLLQPDISAQFTPAESDIFSLNFMPHSYWLHFQLVNNKPQTEHLILELFLRIR